MDRSELLENNAALRRRLLASERSLYAARKVEQPSHSTPFSSQVVAQQRNLHAPSSLHNVTSFDVPGVDGIYTQVLGLQESILSLKSEAAEKAAIHQSLNERVLQTQTEFEHASERNQQLHDENQFLESELAELRKVVQRDRSQYEAAVEEYRKKAGRYEGRIRELEDAIASLRSHCSQLESQWDSHQRSEANQLSSMHHEIQDLKESLAGARAKENEMRNDVAEKSRMVETLKAEMNKQSSTWELERQKLSETAETLRLDARREKDVQEAKINTTVSELNAAKGTLSSMKEYEAMLNKKVAVLEAALEKHKSIEGQLQDKLASNKTKSEQTQTRLEAELKALSQREQQQQMRLTMLEETLRACENDLKRHQTAFAEKATEFGKRDREVSQLRTELKDAHERLSKRSAEVDRRLVTEVSRREAAEEEIKRLEIVVKETKENQRKQREKMSKLQQAQNSLDDERSRDYQLKVEKITAESQQRVEAMQRSTSNAIALLEKQVATLQQNDRKLTEQLMTAQSEKAALENEQSRSMLQVKNMQNELESMAEQLQKSESKFQNQREYTEKLETKVKESERSSISFRDTISALRDRIDKMGHADDGRLPQYDIVRFGLSESKQKLDHFAQTQQQFVDLPSPSGTSTAKHGPDITYDPRTDQYHRHTRRGDDQTECAGPTFSRTRAELLQSSAATLQGLGLNEAAGLLTSIGPRGDDDRLGPTRGPSSYELRYQHVQPQQAQTQRRNHQEQQYFQRQPHHQEEQAHQGHHEHQLYTYDSPPRTAAESIGALLQSLRAIQLETSE